MSRLQGAVLGVLTLAATASIPARAQDHAHHHHEPAPASRGHDAHHAHHDTSLPHTPIPPVTDADRAAAFPPLTRHMDHPSAFNTLLVVDRLEAWEDDAGTGQAWELIGWAGTDLDRLWIRSGGERMGGRTDAASLELLYGRSVSPWWDVVAGLRHDSLPGPSRTRLALGVQGLAPYMFEVQATAYLDDSGDIALDLGAGYDLLLTNRLVLHPEIEIGLSGSGDGRRGIGSGLSTVEAGLRLRYEFTRQFAPYVGLVHERAFGDTVDLHRRDGHDTRDTRIVAGVRIWF